MSGTNQWQCPHCLAWTSLSSREVTREIVSIDTNSDELSQLVVLVVLCRNRTCGMVTITATLFKLGALNGQTGLRGQKKRVRNYPLVPDSRAKPQPAYIPRPIVADYEEACLIAELSPKASATLSRRCLQGMIRDYFGVAKGSLFHEINAIRDHTPPDVWDAIDAVRKVGNIGAHMEKDINVIVEVDEGEARLLLQLIEQLFDDWYVTRQKRRERLDAIKAVASNKEALRKAESDDVPAAVLAADSEVTQPSEEGGSDPPSGPACG